MRTWLLVSAAILTASTPGCFSFDLSGLTYLCDPAKQSTDCPDGQICIPMTHVCSSMDGGVPDLSSSPMLVATAACPAGMGYDVTALGKPNVYACQTKYSNNPNDSADSSSKCQVPYVLCNNATNVDLNTCIGVGQVSNGFFIANAEGNRHYSAMPPTSACGAPPNPMNYYPVWAGCGRMAQSFPQPCQGFIQELDCRNMSGITCMGVVISDVINNDPNSGVLCCHP